MVLAAALALAALTSLGGAADQPAPDPAAVQPAAPAPAAPTTSPAAEPSPGQPAPDPAEAIRQQLAALENERRDLVGRAAAGTTPEGATVELELLATIERALHAQLDALERRDELSVARAALDRRVAAGPSGSLNGTPPYPLALLDAVADARDAQAKQTKLVEDALKAAGDTLENADAELKRREEERRQARDAAAAAQDPLRRADLRSEQHVAELRSRAARAQRDLAVLRRDNLREDAAIQEESGRLLAETVDWVRKRVDTSKDALREPLRAIDDEDFENARNLERTERELHAAEGRLEVAERRLAASPQPTPELSAEVEARRLEQQLLGRRAASLADRTKHLAADRTLWQRRQAVLSGSASRDTLETWATEISNDLAEDQRAARLSEARLLELRQEAQTASQRAAQATAQGGPAAPWEARRAHTLADLAALYEEERTADAGDRRLAERVLEDIHSRTATVSWGEHVEMVARRAVALWDTELFAVDDQAITIGKLIGALLVFVVGLAVSGLLTRLLGRLLRQRLEEGAASAIQGLAFYVLVAITFLLALRTVNIPLTAFAIVGGALAIGIGFGSQNIVNNFISGLILLAERPIKVGDLVEVGAVRGHVERIGARSTRVRTPENTHLIIPNSHFLEQEVINWTLSDDDIRTQIDVGVVYGSPTRDVDRLLRRAMTEHGRIMKNPEPQVWFTGFGDNALEFRALFWVRSRQLTERLRIESDLRFRIDNLFREAGIVIAFPQRDVHLDSVRPISIRVIPESEDAAPDDSSR